MKKINLTDILKKTGAGIALTEAERTRLSRVVRGYVELKPIRHARALGSGAPQSFFFDLYAFLRKPLAAALMLALVVGGGGAAYAAEGTAPGDLLYTMKVNVNEEVRAALSLSTEAKAEWSAERAERRLEEATQLASENRLTETAKQEIAIRFEEHTEKAAIRIEKIEEGDAALALNLASDFETRLAAQEALLIELEADSDDSMRKRIESKVERIRNLATHTKGKFAFENGESDAARSMMAMEATAPASFAVEVAEVVSDTAVLKSAPAPDAPRNIGLEKAAERMKKTAEKTLAYAKESYARSSGTLTEEAKLRADAQLAEAVALIEEGSASFEEGDASAAFRSFQESFGISQKLFVFLKSGARFKSNLFVPRSDDLEGQNDDFEFDDDDADDENERSKSNDGEDDSADENDAARDDSDNHDENNIQNRRGLKIDIGL